MKINRLFLLFVALLCICLLSSQAEEKTVNSDIQIALFENGKAVQNTVYSEGDWKYIYLDVNSVEITGYNGRDSFITIPDQLGGCSVTSVGEKIFAWKDIYSITLPNTITSISEYAFANCLKLNTIQLSKNLQSIGSGAFYNCTSLKSIALPDCVKTIGVNPFRNCEQLVSIYVSPDSAYFAVIDGVLFSKTDKMLICYPEGLTSSSYEIPNGIVTIGEFAFINCKRIKNISIPSTVTAIKTLAFSNCKNLKSVTIPSNVTEIGDSAFYNCQSLEVLYISDSVNHIGMNAFNKCPLLSIPVNPNTYLAEYCKEYNIPHTYPDSLDWLSSP